MAQTPVFEITLLVIILVAIALVVWYSVSQKRSQTVENAYLEALEYMVEGNDRLAIQKLKEAVRHDTENISAYLRLGDLLRRKGMLNNAVRIHKDLTLRGNLTYTDQLRIHKSLLLDYELTKDYDAGITTANNILRLDRNPEAWVVLKLLVMLEKKQQWVEAEQIANKYSGLLPSNYTHRIALYLIFKGLQLQERGSGKDARITFKEALKKDPACVAAYYYLGESYINENRLEDAVKAWKRLCDAAPDKAYIVYPELEKAWFEMGRFADAENLYQEQLNNPKRSLKAGLALTEIYNKKGDYDNALEIMNRMEDEFHTSPELISKKVSVFYNKGQYKQAASHALTLFENRFGKGNSEYTCNVCQNIEETPTWICPKCQSMDSYNI
jgi:lipopolysaccharide biosynthesis regulator YciM